MSRRVENLSVFFDACNESCLDQVKLRWQAMVSGECPEFFDFFERLWGEMRRRRLERYAKSPPAGVQEGAGLTCFSPSLGNEPSRSQASLLGSPSFSGDVDRPNVDLHGSLDAALQCNVTSINGYGNEAEKQQEEEEIEKNLEEEDEKEEEEEAENKEEEGQKQRDEKKKKNKTTKYSSVKNVQGEVEKEELEKDGESEQSSDKKNNEDIENEDVDEEGRKARSKAGPGSLQQIPVAQQHGNAAAVTNLSAGSISDAQLRSLAAALLRSAKNLQSIINQEGVGEAPKVTKGQEQFSDFASAVPRSQRTSDTVASTAAATTTAMAVTKPVLNVKEVVRRELCGLLNVASSVGGTDDLFSLGMDSLHAMQGAARLSRALDCDVAPDDLLENPTIDAVTAAVEGLLLGAQEQQTTDTVASTAAATTTKMAVTKPPVPNVKEIVRRELCGLLNIADVSSVGGTEDLFSLGMDSLHAMQGATRLSRALDCDVAPDDLLENPTIDAVTAAVASLLGSAASNEKKSELRQPVASPAPRERNESNNAPQDDATARRDLVEPAVSFPVTKRESSLLNSSEPLQKNKIISQRLQVASLNKQAFDGAWRHLCARHEALLSYYEFEGVQGWRRKLASSNDVMHVEFDKEVDLVNFASLQALEILSFMRPLTRCICAQMHSTVEVVILSHHMVADLLSLTQIVTKELLSLYDGERLPPVTFPLSEVQKVYQSTREPHRVNRLPWQFPVPPSHKELPPFGSFVQQFNDQEPLMRAREIDLILSSLPGNGRITKAALFAYVVMKTCYRLTGQIRGVFGAFHHGREQGTIEDEITGRKRAWNTWNTVMNAAVTRAVETELTGNMETDLIGVSEQLRSQKYKQCTRGSMLLNFFPKFRKQAIAGHEQWRSEALDLNLPFLSPSDQFFTAKLAAEESEEGDLYFHVTLNPGSDPSLCQVYYDEIKRTFASLLSRVTSTPVPKIMVVTIMEHGHIWAFAGITSDLRQLGYKIVYCCDEEHEQLILKKYGEPAVFKLWNNAPPQAKPYSFRVALGCLTRPRSSPPRPFEIFLLENNVDCLLVDEQLAPAGLMGYKLKLPTAMVPICLSNNYYRARGCAPAPFYRYPFVDEADRVSFEENELRKYKEFMFNFTGGLQAHRTETLIETISYPKDLMSDETGAYPWLKGYPYLILAPKAFQFPGQGDSHEIYCGPCLTPELANCDTGDDAHGPDPDKKPLFVVSFGSQTRAYANAESSFKLLMDAFAKHPEWSVVVSFGAHLESLSQYMKERHSTATHISYDSWIDQTRLIRQASVLVTHGGLSSIKEALYHFVPMLVLPQAHDQFGNAARVDFHKVGIAMPSDPTNWVSKGPDDELGLQLAQTCTTSLLSSLPAVTASRLEDALTKLVADPAYKANVTQLGQEVRREQKQKIAANFIHKMIQNNPYPCKPTPS